jgi:glycosidase
MAALTFVYPGIPLIYSGQEVGNQKQIAFFEKDLIPGLSKENAFTTFYSKLIALKSKNNALWNDSPATLNPLDSNNPEVISFSRSRGGNRVIMIFNISTIKQAVKVKLGSLSGKYKVFSSGKSISYNGASTLAPWGFEIYSST